MFRSTLFALLLSLLLPGATPMAHGGIAEYTDRGRTDFDTVVQLLNPYGTWAKIDGLWAYTPLNHYAPYTSGRWLYTEYGWYWQGTQPSSWATEHYGYWKRSTDHVWSWFPGAYWVSQTVEIRATPTHIGWRSAAVDDDGNFVEEPADRYAKTDEWTFVTRAQFAGPITPAIIASPDVAARLLDDTTDCMHTYVTYRPITRPGPHPADFVALCRDGLMFAPQVYVNDLPPQKASPPATSTNAIPATSSRAIPTADDTDGQTPDPRQVRYWITMSLPTYWTPRPPEAKPTEVYMYRPEIAQDSDGIERRIGLWIDPSTRKSLGVRLQDIFGASKPSKNDAAPSGPGTPAVPVTASTRGPFQSPFDESFRSNAAGSNAPSSSSKTAPAGAALPAPSGAVSPTPTNLAPDKGA
jgi:hypothetical protein